MNDLDLRAALHRDAGLVGEPSPDLLDRLGRRRAHQRRQRTVLTGAVAAVVVIAAGIPIGVSLAVRSATTPATQPIAPTPTVSQQVTPMPSPTASASSMTVTPPSTSRSPDPSAANSATPPCPSAAEFRAVLLADTGGAADTVRVNPASPEPECAGTWGVTALDHVGTDGNGTVHETTFVQLFRYVAGAWTAVDRVQNCEAGQVPARIEFMTCETD